MPTTGPLSRVLSLLESHRDRHERQPVDGTSIRLGGLVVFLALVVLMVLAASPSMAATAETDIGAWDGVINLAPLLFWVAVGIGVVVRIVLGRRSVTPEARRDGSVSASSATRPPEAGSERARPGPQTAA